MRTELFSPSFPYSISPFWYNFIILFFCIFLGVCYIANRFNSNNNNFSYIK